VPLTTVPSIIWRMGSLLGGLVSGDNPCFGPGTPMWEQLYLLAVLPAAQLGLALLTVGLIRPWGEVFPRWLPALVVAGWRWPSPWAPPPPGPC
jgi:hypothetical protein